MYQLVLLVVVWLLGIAVACIAIKEENTWVFMLQLMMMVIIMVLSLIQLIKIGALP